jgi:hypothetical protein
MSEFTVKQLLAWFEEQDDETLQALANDLVERGFADPLSDGSEVEWADDERDDGLLDEAAARLRRHEYGETLRLLANALGRDFYALADLRVQP